MRPHVWLALAVALAAAGLSSGCVTRRVMITSEPPGAQVYRDGQPLGPTPVEQPFVYYGRYRYRLVKDGYAPLDVEPQLNEPWYQYPGIDFVFENVLPFSFRDTQVLHFELSPLVPVLAAETQSAGEALRARAATIGQPGPRPPRPRNQPAPAPVNTFAGTGATTNATGDAANAGHVTNDGNPPDDTGPLPADGPPTVNAAKAKAKPAVTAGFQTVPASRPQTEAAPTSAVSPSR